MTELQLSFSHYLKENEICGEVLLDEPLKKHCNFKIGGTAEVLFSPENEKDLKAAFDYIRAEQIKYHVIGNGSNILVSDKGLSGIVIKISGCMNDMIYLGDGVVACGAGAALSKLAVFAREKALSGLEFAHGIPGCVGGAVYMNAGAYGGEIKNVLFAVRTLNPESGEIREIPADELSPYGYRNTFFMYSNEIITAAYFQLKKGSYDDIKKQMDELSVKRRASQPLEYPSAGSTFKRPENGYAAALIDKSGLKGTRVGGAAVSEKHAGFVINTGDASFSDVLELTEIIKKTVKEKFDVSLELEVEILED